MSSISTEKPCYSSCMVRLHVGGRQFCTNRDTLTRNEPDSRLATMFRDQEKREYFIYGDGKYFRHILNWLRDGVVPTLEDSKYPKLLGLAEYYQLAGLIDGIKNRMPHFTWADILKRIVDISPDEPKSFHGCDLSGVDLSRLDLSNSDFTKACLRNTRFSGATLLQARFIDADAEGAIFDDADLQCSEFSGANLRGASFVGANLSCYYEGKQIKGPDGARFAHVDAEGAKFDKANLYRSVLHESNLRGASFVRARLGDAWFRDINAEDAVFDEANLEGSEWRESNLGGASFAGAKRNTAKFWDSNNNIGGAIGLDGIQILTKEMPFLADDDYPFSDEDYPFSD